MNRMFGSLCAATVILALSGLVVPALSADRVVLIEHFTANW